MGRRRKVLASAAAAAASLAFAASASAATIQVDSTGDELVATPFPVAGSCTLREALKSAEDNNAFGGCTPGAPGNDIITFSPTVFPNPTTINLTIGQLVVNTDVTITGPGHGELIVKAAPTARVLWIVGGTVTLSGLNIEGGDLSSDPLTYHAEGGGILSSGDLTLDDVVVKSNQLTATSVAGFDAVAGGGGIYQQGSGSLTLDHSTVSGNTATAHNPQADDLDSYVQGAGIITFAPITVSHSSIAGNQAISNNDLGNGDPNDIARALGTGLFTSFAGPSVGTLAMDHSTVSGNTSTANSGEGDSQIIGSGIYINADSTIELSTIADNTGSGSTPSGMVFQEGGGLYNPGNTASVKGSTFAGNGGSTGIIIGANISTGGDTTLKSTIVSGPLGGLNCQTAATSAGYNIDSGTSCSLGGTADQSSTDPMLDPGGLADNGGPTKTIALVPGSPALDAGSSGGQTDATHDQRGLERPVVVPVPPAPAADDFSDVGAYEAQAPDPPTFTATNPVSPSSVVTPLVKGSAPGAVGPTGVTLFDDTGCSTSVGSGSPADFASPGIGGAVSTNSTTTFYGTSTNAFGIPSACSSTLPSGGSIAYTHDNIDPAAPSLTSTSPGSPGNSTTPNVIGSAEAGSTVKLYKDALCAGSFVSGSAATLASPGIAGTAAPNATTPFYATATDAAGNTSDCSSAITYTHDGIPPAAPSLTSTSPASPSTSTTPNVIGSAEAGSTVKLYKDACTGSFVSGSAATLASPGIAAAATPNATTSFQATATDAAGNPSSCSSAITYLSDSLSPGIAIDTGPSDSTDHTPTFTFHAGVDASPPITFRCSIDTGTASYSACTSPITSASLPDGSYTFRVKAKDALDNEDASPATLAFSITTPVPPPPPAAGSTGQRAAALKKCKKKKGAKRKKCKKKANKLPV